MPLHPQVKTMLEAGKAAGIPPLRQLSIQQARDNMNANAKPDGPSVGTIHARRIDGPHGSINLRVYTPRGGGPHPVLVYFHGGGFVLGSLDTHDNGCRHLCVGAGCVVVSVDYRLAPEHKFPAAPDDCYTALQWVQANASLINVDGNRIVVGGDSAGGNLAAAVALRARDENGPALRGQLLIYPVADHYAPGTPSYIANGNDYGLTRDSMIWFWDHYLASPDDANHPYASPLRAKSLAGLPPAWVITAEYDPLLDEGERYAQALKAAAVPTEYQCFDGMQHGFFGWVGVLDRSREATDLACAWLRGVMQR